MHHRGTSFVTSLSGGELHRSGYASPAWWVPNPIVSLRAADDLQYACSYVNETAEAISDGSSLLDDERCVLFAEITTAQKPQETCF